MRLLIIEDDSCTARYLLRGLSESGHVVDHAAEGIVTLTSSGDVGPGGGLHC